eukprot:evm.model.scf_632.3 EVM.evm.TU.scf_632.3   scf_632:32006-32935(-)
MATLVRAAPLAEGPFPTAKIIPALATLASQRRPPPAHPGPVGRAARPPPLPTPPHTGPVAAARLESIRRGLAYGGGESGRPMMADMDSISSAIEHLVAGLIGDGMLDDQFRQLMSLQNEQSPDFLTEVVQLFFLEGHRRLTKFGQMLGDEGVELGELGQAVLDFKGSTASFGAKFVTDLCDTLRGQALAGDREACRATLGQQEEALGALEARMNAFLELELERKAAMGSGGGDPAPDCVSSICRHPAIRARCEGLGALAGDGRRGCGWAGGGARRLGLSRARPMFAGGDAGDVASIAIRDGGRVDRGDS